MRIIDSCAKCLYDKQARRSNDAEYLQQVKDLLDHRTSKDSAPYLVYRFNQLYTERFGPQPSYAEVKKQYNDLVLSMEAEVRKKIEASADPIMTALLYARVGNYIDFAAMSHVDENTFIALLNDAVLTDADRSAMHSMLSQCEGAKNFLLLADNCGEIVLDKLFLEQIHKRFPDLHLTVMVRGGEAVNDATMEDALYTGIDQIAELVTNGYPITGTVYEILPPKARAAMDQADVILSKGQGNYEALNGHEKPIYYSFLCKCELFTNRFEVPRFTGIFIRQ